MQEGFRLRTGDRRMSDAAFNKIEDSVLRDFAAGGGKFQAPRSVIIEVDAPPVQVHPPRTGARRVAERPTRQVKSAPSLDVVEKRMRALAISPPPVKLTLADAIVATVTPAQMREIAGWPEVAVIRPNRVHHASVGR